MLYIKTRDPYVIQNKRMAHCVVFRLIIYSKNNATTNLWKTAQWEQKVIHPHDVIFYLYDAEFYEELLPANKFLSKVMRYLR